MTIDSSCGVSTFAIVIGRMTVRCWINILHCSRRFPEIEEIAIRISAGLTDEGLAAVAELPRLRRLQMYEMENVNGGFLAKLSTHPALVQISFKKCPCSGRGYWLILLH